MSITWDEMNAAVKMAQEARKKHEADGGRFVMCIHPNWHLTRGDCISTKDAKKWKWYEITHLYTGVGDHRWYIRGDKRTWFERLLGLR